MLCYEDNKLCEWILDMETHVESKRRRANTNKQNRKLHNISWCDKEKVENKALKRVNRRLVELEVKGEENEEEN